MPDPRTDNIAREAARLLEAGRCAGIDEAIRTAAGVLGLHGVELPGRGRVRKHARARAMQALGEEGYAESVRDVWRAAERLMTVLSEAMPDCTVLLAGRAAEGLIDAGVTVHVRLYAEAPIGAVAQALVDFGYDEPAFETAATRLGRLDRLRLADGDLELVVTRCLPHMVDRAGLDLFTAKPVKTAALDRVRSLIAGRRQH